MDAQHPESILEDRDTQSILQFIECSTTTHKIAGAIHLRNVALPLVAPCYGVCETTSKNMDVTSSHSDDWRFEGLPSYVSPR